MSSLSPLHRFPLGFQKMKQKKLNKRNMGRGKSLFSSSPARVFVVCVVGCRKLRFVRIYPQHGFTLSTNMSFCVYTVANLLCFTPPPATPVSFSPCDRRRRDKGLEISDAPERGGHAKRGTKASFSHARPVFSISQSLPSPLIFAFYSG